MRADVTIAERPPSKADCGHGCIDTEAIRGFGRVGTIAADGDDATLAGQTVGFDLLLALENKHWRAPGSRCSSANPIPTITT